MNARLDSSDCDSLFLTSPTALQLFIVLLSFRYTKLLVNLVAFWLYKPKTPGVSAIRCLRDVTVIVPTVDPASTYIRECIESIYDAGPALIIIVAAGFLKGRFTNYHRLIQDWQDYPKIRLMDCEVMKKRMQICMALADVGKL